MKYIALATAASLLAASGAFAKGHDQGSTEVPGADNVGSVTVTTAQSLGGNKSASAGNIATEKAGR